MSANEKNLSYIDNIKLLYANQCEYEYNWLSIPHTHPFTELFYVTKGSGEFQIKDQTFNIQADDLILVNPHISHTERSTNKDFEYIVLGIENFIFSESTDDEQERDFSIYNYENNKHEVLFYLKTILLEIPRQNEYSEKTIDYLLKVLILNLLKNTSSTIYLTSKLDASKECQTVQRYIKKHFKENISLDTLSELVFLNKYYLAHAFKKYHQISPIQYQIHLRIKEAKNLLSTTNLGIADISNSLGFSSQSYFSQAFKKEMGITPNQYRKEKHKD